MDSVRRVRRTRGALLAGMVVLASTLTVAQPAVASAPLGPAPATTNPVALITSQSDGLLAGQAVTLTVNTSGGTTLVGGLNVHLCRHGLTNYGSTNFGYSGLTATRCVYGEGIVSGGLPGADYEQSFGPYAGSETSSGPLTFHVGTGSVTWGNATGAGPVTLQADAANPVDLVVQVNLAGDDTPTTYFVQPITFATVPDAPTAVSAARGNGDASVSFTAPPDGGSPISTYSASCESSDGGAPGSATGTSSPVLVTGLTNLSTYTCTATATNGAGTSDPSAPSNTFVPDAVPDPPTGLVATPGPDSASVAFTPPVNVGGSPISGYSVSCVSADGGASASGSGAGSPVLVSGLTQVKTYTCTAAATNDSGTGRSSDASNAVVPEAVPAAPTLLSAVAGNAKATLHWTTPSNSAAAGVTGYAVTGYIGYYAVVHQTFNSTVTTQVVAGLTNGKAYAFRVAAVNANGTGAPSGVVSAGVIGAPSAPIGLQATAGKQQATLRFTVRATNGSPVTAYVVTVFIAGVRSYAGQINSTSMSTVTVMGLTTGKHYSFKIAARNARGVGLQSTISNVVTPT